MAGPADIRRRSGRGGEPTIGGVGELEVIRRITREDAEGASLGAGLVGPGDDAAVVRQPDGRVVACTDMLVEGRHFRVDWSSPEDIGAKAIAQNGADISAMGAVCTGFLVALGCPAGTPESTVEGISRGARAEAAEVAAAVLGGDLVQAGRIVVSVTALGDLRGVPPVLRTGARPGDEVAVAGRLGGSAAGLALLTAGVRPGTDAGTAERALIEAHRRPRPPYSQGPEAAGAGATSMLDVSDGLLCDSSRIAEASGVTIDLRRDALAPGGAAAATGLPDAARRLGLDPWDWILAGGEDHALVATFPTGRAPEGWTVIGRVLRDGVTAGEPVLVDGAPRAGARGWGGFDA